MASDAPAAPKPPDQRTPDQMRQAVVFAARYRYAQQVFTDTHANGHPWIGNKFPPPDFVHINLTPEGRRAIWRAVLPPDWSDAKVDQYQAKHWCGAFSLLCLKDAQLPGAADIFWKDGVGYVEPHHFPHTTKPKPGDIAYFDKLSHYAIVTDVYADTFASVDGNQGTSLAEPCIKLKSRPLAAARTFYSIAHLVGEQ